MKYSRVWSLMLTALLLLVSTALGTEVPEVWRSLEPGAYAVGFRTIESFDQSRVYVPKYDYMGQPTEGVRSRPIQVCVWYPATVAEDALQMTYGEYAFPYPADERLFPALARLQDREIQTLFAVTGNEAAVLQMMSIPMYAVRDAQPIADTFPLVIYHQSLTGASSENAVLCEYLASHGFIVMTTPALGMTYLTPNEHNADLENLIRDKEYALGLLGESDELSFDKVLLLGNQIGALAALDMQMRNPDVEAVIALGDWLCDSLHAEFCRRSPSFNSDRVNVPLLLLASSDTAPDQTETVFASLEYSPRTVLKGGTLQGSSFVHYPMFTSLSPELEAMISPMRQNYEQAGQAILLYLESLTGGELEFSSAVAGSLGETMTTQELPAKQLPPSVEQFTSLLLGGHVDTAVALFYYFREMEPERVLFAEATVNALGYRALLSGDSERAIKLFVINTVSYPNSCNTWDSLSDGYLAAGDNENAIIAMRRALETLATDTTNPDALKDQIRTKCEQTIADLGG